MKSCTYNYNGHTFNSELELDDFLLEKEKFIPSRGDAVFSENIQTQINKTKLKKILDISDKLTKEWDEGYKAAKLLGDEQVEQFKENGPYIGVNKFLSGRTSEITGKLFFPEFREKEYWEHRIGKWKAGEFDEESEEDKKILGISDETLGITDSEILDKMRKKIEAKWEHQAKVGTAIHSILQYYFSPIASSSKNKGLPHFVTGNVEMSILKQFKGSKTYTKDGIEHKSVKYIDDDILTEDQVKQVILVCKKLLEKIEAQFGNNNSDDPTRGITYFPELKLSSKILSNDAEFNEKSLLGMIDLLILDKEGTPQIIDYKTSPKQYSKYGDAKKHTIRYQLATYRRMLNKHGIDTRKTGVHVVPVELTEFTYDELEGKFKFGSVNIPNQLICDMTSDIASMESIENNISEFLPENSTVTVESENILENVSEFMKKCFPNYGNVRSDDEYLNKVIKNNGGFQTNDEGKIFVHLSNDSGWSFTAEGEDEKTVKDKIKKYFESGEKRNKDFTINMINLLEKAMKNNSSDLDLGLLRTQKDGESNWLLNLLEKYCNDEHYIIRNDACEELGIILILNKITKVVDVIRVTNKYLHKPVTFNTHSQAKNLLGEFETDTNEQTNQDSLMLKAINGNVLLMETMLALNSLKLNTELTIGNVQLIKPLTQQGLSATNKELLYCFDKLLKKSGMKNNMEDNIKMLTFTEQAVLKFKQLCDSAYLKNTRFENMGLSYNELESIIKDPNTNFLLNKNDLVRKFSELARTIEEHFPELKRVDLGVYKLSDHPEIVLYNHILLAIAELRNVNFRLQLKDHDKFYDSHKNILTQGLSGTYIDNPGMLDSETLNLCTRLTLETYQNIRDEVTEINDEVNERIIKLKKEKNFRYGNLVSLYDNMIEKRNGDLYFKNPFRESIGPGNDFLKFALLEINRRRYPNKTDSDFEEMIRDSNSDYFKVPLMKGGSDSIVNKKGILGLAKARLENWNPKRILKSLNEELGIFFSENDWEYELAEDIYKVINYLDNSKNPETRKRIIDGINHRYEIDESGNEVDKMSVDEKLDYFETDIEKILLSYVYGESLCRNMNEQMPLMKAAAVSLAVQGRQQGGIQFKNDKQYIEDYIKNKIKNESIEDKSLKKPLAYIEKLKSIYSKIALGFSPVLAIYLSLEGIWKDISLIVRKPDGTNAFSCKNMMFGFKTAWRDLFTKSGSKHPTLCLKINELYGINDMDMNSYIERIKNNKNKWYNFDHYLFKFASRPDFYNRMTIMIALMKENGCWEAHSVKNGRLVYDMSKDSRFGATANLLMNDPKYRNSKERIKYLQYIDQMIKEGVKVRDKSTGRLRLIQKGDNLPRALTNQEAESFKNICDQTYGYYTHEKKALVQSLMWGGLALQMRTYLTAKKNQYLGSGGIKINGHFELLKNDNDELLFYQLNDEGNVDYDLPPVTQNDPKYSGIAFEQWQGNWQEGIVCTSLLFIGKFFETKSWNQTKEAFFGDDVDETLKTAYKQNFRLLGYDTLMFAIIGNIIAACIAGWDDEAKKIYKDTPDLLNAMMNSAVSILTKSINNSFMDFNAWKIFGEASLDWKPFAGSMTINNFKSALKVFSGDLDVYDALINSCAVTRQFKPVFKTIKMNTFEE